MTDRWVPGFESPFTKAAADWARTNGGLKGEQLSEYFQTKLRYVNYDVYQMALKRLAARRPSDPRVALEDDAVSMGLVPIHLVYMDVGCWAGDGGPGWTRHREFGLVYGHLALLCGFSDEPTFYSKDLNCPKWNGFKGKPKSTPFIEANVFTHPDFPRVADLLNSLAGIEEFIGPLYILGATMVSSPVVPVPKTGKNEPITVFIGDLHAPVATNSGNAHILDSGRERLLGRLDFGPAVLDLLPVSVSAKAGWFAAEILRAMDFGTDTSREAVERWLGYYHQPGRRTADVFQGAGHDLKLFVDWLRNFHEIAWPLKVVQLGDFFDLWMGFRRAFKGPVTSERNLVPQAMDFARFWVERTLFKTEQGEGLVRLLTLSQTAGPNAKTGARLQTEFLYGNHDNYRKFGIDESDYPLVVPDGRPQRGMKLEAFRGIYVMGHSHEPMLKRIELWPRPPRKKATG